MKQGFENKIESAQSLQSSKLFQLLVEKSADLQTLSTREGKMFYASPSITRILGYSTNEFLSEISFKSLHPDELPGFIKKREDVLKNPGKSFQCRLRLLHKNGNWIWCEGTVTNMLHEPDIKAMVASFRDISKLKAAEELHELDSNNLNALINSTNDLMWSVDKDLKLIIANQPFDEMVKQMSGSAIPKGTNILSIDFSPEQLSRFQGYYERALRGETFYEIEYSSIPFEIWSEISYYPIRKNGEVIGTACHSRNITESKKTETRLQQSENRLQKAQALAHLGNWESNFKTGKVFWSNEICKMLGLAPNDNEYSFEKWLSFIHPEDLDYVQLARTEATKTFSDTILIHRMISNDGTIKHVYSEAKFQFDKTGKPSGLFGIVHDITELKEAEQELKKSESFSRGVLNSLNSHIAVVDSGGNIVAVNEAWNHFSRENGDSNLRHTGQGANYFKVCETSAASGNKAAAEVLTGMKEVLQKKRKDFYFEYPCHSPVKQRWFGMCVMKFESEEPMVVVTHQNITERKIAEEKQKQGETRFRELFQSAPVPMTVVDLDTLLFIQVNNNIIRLLKYSEEDLMKRGPFDISPPFQPDGQSSKEKAKEFIEDAMKGGKPVFEYVHLDANGKELICKVRLVLLTNTETPQMLACIVDITDIRKAERIREKMTDDLIQRNKDLEQFSYIVSHNLRAPVANILGASSELNDPNLSNDDKQALSEGLNESVTRLDDVVKDLNYILQVKREISETKEIVHFSKMVKDIKISIKNLIDKNNIEIRCNFSEVDAFLSYKSYLHSIFYNLISNSIKYRQPLIPCTIDIKSYQAENKVGLTFTDNGMGIDLQKRGDQVFGLYKRFHLKIEGKGMGLFMVKTQVEALGGKISITSEVNKGTEFKIVFE